jgi:hypothetical protein
MKTGPGKTLLRDDSGAAFAEGLIVVPPFALLLAGILAISATYSAKLEAKGRARRAGWLQADSGSCPARACTGEGCEAIADEIRSSGLDRLPEVQSSGLSLRRFLGRVRDYFLGRVTRAIGTASARLPGLLRKERTEQRGVSTLLCNTSARGVESGESVLQHACSTGLQAMEYAGEVCD